MKPKGDVGDEKKSKRPDYSLQFVEEASRLCPIHLGVVELEGNLESRLEEEALVPSPNEEGIVEDAAIHSYRPIYVVLHQSRSANNHTVGQVVISATLSHLPCERQVLFIEEGQILAEGDIARADLALLVCYDGIDGEAVELHQLPAFGQQIELFYAARSPAYAVAHQHIELQAFPPAYLHKPRHIERFEERHHRHRCFHPHLESVSTTRLFWIDFLFHCSVSFPDLATASEATMGRCQTYAGVLANARSCVEEHTQLRFEACQKRNKTSFILLT